jgi:hypothetical protein
VFGGNGFSWSFVNYAPMVTIGVILIVTIWYLGWARKTFKGPIRTIDEPGDGAGPVAVAPAVG